jgi:hypothetical protein
MPTLRKTTGTLAPAGVPESGTLAAWCEAHHDGAIETDAVIRAEGLEVRVRKIRRRKVMEAVICRSATEMSPAISGS